DGQIMSVNIGEGLPTGGTGDVPLSGIFAGDILDTVINQGTGSDIRGPVIVGFLQNQSAPQVLFPTSSHLGSIRLRNGALIGADVHVTGTVTDWRAYPHAFGIREFSDTVNNPIYDLASIQISGIGGIIGSYIQGPDIGPIQINGGFGILNTIINSLGDN